MGFLFNSGKKAAKEQAAATLASANMQASNDRQMAQAAESSRETLQAQDSAAKAAAALLSTPQQTVDVSLGTETDPSNVDAEGRRIKPRQAFQAAKPTSGINLT